MAELDRLDATVRSRNPFEWAISAFTLFLFTGAIVGVLDGHFTETGRGPDPSLALKVGLVVVYAFSLYVTVRDRAFIPAAQRRDAWLCVLLGLALASTYWSELPLRTFGRAIQLIMTTWFGAYLARAFSRKELILLLEHTLLAVMIASLIAGMLFPDYGIMHGGEFEGAWRGAFIHKNYLGRICLLGLIVFVAGWYVHREHRTLAGFGIALSAVLLALSTSRTAIVSVGLVLAIVPLFRSMRRRGIGLAVYATITLLVLAGGSWWAYLNLDYLFQLLGRNVTLSGRTALWFAVAAFISQRPLLGYGYSAFWQGMAGNSGYISLALHWEVPHAHNGLLDLALDTGLIGVAIFLICFAGVTRRAVQFLRSSPDKALALWPLLYISFIVVSNAAESSLIRYGNAFWALFVAVTLSGAAPERNAPVSDE